RSFPKVPHLLQYVSNCNYYGRNKVGGKTIRERAAMAQGEKAANAKKSKRLARLSKRGPITADYHATNCSLERAGCRIVPSCERKLPPPLCWGASSPQLAGL